MPFKESSAVVLKLLDKYKENYNQYISYENASSYGYTALSILAEHCKDPEMVEELARVVAEKNGDLSLGCCEFTPLDTARRLGSLKNLLANEIILNAVKRDIQKILDNVSAETVKALAQHSEIAELPAVKKWQDEADKYWEKIEKQLSKMEVNSQTSNKNEATDNIEIKAPTFS